MLSPNALILSAKSSFPLRLTALVNVFPFSLHFREILHNLLNTNFICFSISLPSIKSLNYPFIEISPPLKQKFHHIF